jgi:hypothetical protein
LSVGRATAALRHHDDRDRGGSLGGGWLAAPGIGSEGVVEAPGEIATQGLEAVDAEDPQADGDGRGLAGAGLDPSGDVVPGGLRFAAVHPATLPARPLEPWLCYGWVTRAGGVAR